MINDDIIIYDHLCIYCIFLRSSNAVSLQLHTVTLTVGGKLNVINTYP